jgi:hypothetical protein
MQDLVTRVWWAITEATVVIQEAETVEMRLRGISALSTAAGIYAKLLETSDLEARMQAIEDRLRSTP